MLDKLKGIFFETDGEQSVQKSQPVQQPLSAPVTTPTYTDAAIVPAVSYSEGIPDQKFIEFFNELLTSANIPGPDYYEFRKNIETSTKNPATAAIAEQHRFVMV